MKLMTNLEDPFLDDVVHRAEQYRQSYNNQTEEFRHLNSNLFTYLDEIKTIDGENGNLQEKIEQLRRNFLLDLENSLNVLPKNFRQLSEKLTDAHHERYKFKSRARRFANDREELKRRIQFVSNCEKDQLKRLAQLQKEQRSTGNECRKLNEQYENLLHFVEKEKEIHQQSMSKVDQLQCELEQIYVERSKSEVISIIEFVSDFVFLVKFQIQSLKEEVQLMQTAREFLDDERQTILMSQSEANEFLLSRLTESIQRIREDFQRLNQCQIEELEIEYKHKFEWLEEQFRSESKPTTLISNNIEEIHRHLVTEQRSTIQELNFVTDQHKILSAKILALVKEEKIDDRVENFLFFFFRNSIFILFGTNERDFFWKKIKN